ncbi:MAG TPA: hypothetical protein VM370_04085 [Candidatus Thermoplasmatota archaeon]|nr:hypothetical protein [Candidatus Thermoplasmatota archaeon]
MRAGPALALVLALALALAPALAAAQAPGGMAPPPADTGYAGGPIDVPLYAHIYDLLQPVPINTQPMIDLDLARGFGSPSVAGVGPLETPASLRFYSSPGLVEYNLTEDGFPRHHPERGISYDLQLDGSKNVIGHFFLGVKALDAPQAGQTAGPETGVAAALTVRMTMRTGDDIGADLDAGALIAQGQTTLSPDKWPVNGAPVEFVVDMGAPQLTSIPGNDSFNVKVEWFNAEAPDGSVRVVQRDWVVHTGEKFPNRVDVSVAAPLALYSLRPTPLGSDEVSIHAVLNSPFGNYDVDVGNVTMTIEGPTTPSDIKPPLVVQRSFEHNHHYEPVELTWVWNYHAQSAAPGTYTVTVTAPNLQHTATVTKTASFVVPESGRAVGYDDTGAVVAPQGEAAPNETPGFAPLALALAFALALLARRRL